MECLYIMIILGKHIYNVSNFWSKYILRKIPIFSIFRCYWFSVAEHTDDLEGTDVVHNGR